MATTASADTDSPREYLPLSLRDKYLLNEQLPSDTDKTPTAQIDWEPNYDTYTAREKKRLATETLTTSLPEGWPQKVESPLAWTKDSLPNVNEYIFTLTTEEEAEIESALNHFKSLGLAAKDISTESFPLVHLANKLRDLSNGLYTGIGFFVLRGLNPSKYSSVDNSLIFLGVSTYVGDKQGRQDQDANMIGHVMDAGTSADDKSKVQSVYTNVAQPFHNDVFCDILALQTRACAQSGGKNILSSATTVYNELAAERPDLIDTLAADNWTFDTFGRNPPFYQRPLLFFQDGNVIMNFSRRLLTGSSQSPRTLNIPPMTEAQAEALDAVHFKAKKHELSMDMKPGDLRYINNLAILHCRDDFTDDDTTKRYLVRLWLKDTQRGWKTPSKLQMASDRVFADLPDVNGSWDLDPVFTDKLLMSRQKSCGQG